MRTRTPASTAESSRSKGMSLRWISSVRRNSRWKPVPACDSSPSSLPCSARAVTGEAAPPKLCSDEEGFRRPLRAPLPEGTKWLP